MTTLTVLDNGFIQLPPNILQFFGLKKGDTLEINTSPKHLIIEPKTAETKMDEQKTPSETFVLDDETKALIEKSFGMFKVDSKKIRHDIDDLGMSEIATQFYDEKDLM